MGSSPLHTGLCHSPSAHDTAQCRLLPLSHQVTLCSDPGPLASGTPSPLCGPSHSTRPLQNLALDRGRCSCLLEAGPHPAGLPTQAPTLPIGCLLTCPMLPCTMVHPTFVQLRPSKPRHAHPPSHPHTCIWAVGRSCHKDLWGSVSSKFGCPPAPYPGAGTGLMARRAPLGHLSSPIARAWPLELCDAPQAPPVHTCALHRLAFRHHPPPLQKTQLSSCSIHQAQGWPCPTCAAYPQIDGA